MLTKSENFPVLALLALLCLVVLGCGQTVDDDDDTADDDDISDDDDDSTPPPDPLADVIGIFNLTNVVQSEGQSYVDFSGAFGTFVDFAYDTLSPAAYLATFSYGADAPYWRLDLGAFPSFLATHGVQLWPQPTEPLSPASPGLGRSQPLPWQQLSEAGGPQGSWPLPQLPPHALGTGSRGFLKAALSPHSSPGCVVPAALVRRILLGPSVARHLSKSTRQKHRAALAVHMSQPLTRRPALNNLSQVRLAVEQVEEALPE